MQFSIVSSISQMRKLRPKEASKDAEQPGSRAHLTL